MKHLAIGSARLKEVPKTLAALTVAFCVWLPSMHFFFSPHLANYRPAHGISTPARELAAVQVEMWADPILRAQQVRELRAACPEWDFMNRTYAVLSFANMALRDRSYKRTACRTMDALIDDTLALERRNGFGYFLLPYGRNGDWTINPSRSIFVDGEISLMLAARRMVEEKPAYKLLLQRRVRDMTRQMARSPVLSAESYPDECWTFCNTIALASIRIADVLDGTDHSQFLSSWVRTAKARLIDRKTGLLISAFEVDGTPALCGAGAEGSSIWMVCNMLQIIDAKFAKQQYRLAKQALGASVLGFGYAREWPRGSDGGRDIDSGPIAPLLEISPSSTGLATVGAAAFDDDSYFAGIFASIQVGGLPLRHDGKLKYCASNLVGDAVLLYAMTEGPLWNAVRSRTH